MLVIAATAFIHADSAKAYSAGSSGNTTLWAYSWDTGEIARIDWTVSSALGYSVGWNGASYTRVTFSSHDAKTKYNRSGYSGLASSGVRTTLYSGGVYMASLHSLNGSCTGPNWNEWWCDSGTHSMYFYGDGSAKWTGYMTLGGGGWGSYSGTSRSGSFSWS